MDDIERLNYAWRLQRLTDEGGDRSMDIGVILSTFAGRDDDLRLVTELLERDVYVYGVVGYRARPEWEA